MLTLLLFLPQTLPNLELFRDSATEVIRQ